MKKVMLTALALVMFAGSAQASSMWVCESKSPNPSGAKCTLVGNKAEQTFQEMLDSASYQLLPVVAANGKFFFYFVSK